MPGGRLWTHREDSFIVSCVKRGLSNKQIFEAFCAEFGPHRGYTAIAKRRFLLDTIEHDNKTPSAPDERINVELGEETGDIFVMASTSIKSPEDLFRKSGLDPEVWELHDVSSVRKWDVPMRLNNTPVVVECYYVGIKVRKRWEHTSLPRPVVVKFSRPALIKKATSGVYQSVHYSDLHIPYHDPSALNILYKVISDVQPDIVVDHGDTLDCHEISKYPKDPHNRVSLKDEIIQAAQHFAAVSDLTPGARRIWCEGNHEERLKRLIWGLAEGRNAGEILTLPSVTQSLSWPSLLGLDDLGWEMVPYPKHELLFNRLIVCHGERVRSLSGQSEKSELEHYSKSGISGHTHRIGYYGKKTYDGQLGWWGIGCLCSLSSQYISFPNWQQGFAVVSWSDDKKNFAVERIRVFDGKAFFRGKLYQG